MQPLIIWLQELGDAAAAQVGSKAANLAMLLRHGFNVPPTFCITAHAYRAFVATTPSVNDAISAATALTTSIDFPTLQAVSTAVQTAISQAELPQELLRQIEVAYTDPQLGSFPAAIAIRSSATAEDLPSLSFAGQYESFLNVEGLDWVAVRVRDCWASLWSPRAIQYRLRHHLMHESLAMAVICQQMVPASHAGVLFTSDPISSDQSIFVVNIHPGLGEAVVSGSATAVQVRIRRTDFSTVSTDRSAAPIISEVDLHNLGAVGRAIEEAFGNIPQDIEWAYARKRLYILQSRPITTLTPRFVDPDITHHWDRKILAEWMEEPLSPMFGTLLVPSLLDAAINLFQSELGCRLQTPLTYELHGYLYVRSDINWLGSLAAPLKLPRFLARMDTRWHTEVLPAYQQRIQTLQREEVAVMNDEVLLSHLGAAGKATGDFIGWVLVSAVACQITETIFAVITRLLEPNNGKLGYVRYLTGIPSQTAKSAIALSNIAHIIRTDETLKQLILTGDNASILEALQRTPSGGKVWSDVQSYLMKFGHQSLRLDLVHPTLIESSSPLWSTLRLQLTRDRTDGSFTLDNRQAAREHAIKERLDQFSRWSPTKMIWKAALQLAQRYIAIRDDRPFYMQLGWPILRHSLMEFGQRFVARGWLSTADDIFYLEYPELRRAVLRSTMGWTINEIEKRKQLRLEQTKINPPDRINSGGFTKWLDLVWKPQVGGDVNVLQGYAGSPGKSRGNARIIFDENDYISLQEPGSILVTRVTTPSWTPLFALVSGVITEVGSPLSHAAIVAREYGIPCVVGVPNVTQRITDGQMITVDGNNGCVVLHES